MTEVQDTEDIVDVLNNLAGRLDEVEQTLTSTDVMTGPQTNEFPTGIIIGSDHYGTPITLIVPQIGVIPGVLTTSTGSFYDDIFIDVSWTAPPDLTASDYYLELAKKTGPSSYTPSTFATTAGTSYRFHGLDPDSTYGVRVTPKNKAGNYGTPTPNTGYTDQVTTHDATIPAVPGGIAVTAGLKSIVVRFNDLDPVLYPDVARGKGTYEVHVATASDFVAGLKVSISSATIHTFTDILSAGTTYYVRVRSIDTSGNVSSWSATSTISPGQAGAADLADAAVIATKLAPGSTNRIMDGSFEGTNISRYWTPSSLFAPPAAGWARNTDAPLDHGSAHIRWAASYTSVAWGSYIQRIQVTPGETLSCRFRWRMSANARQSHVKVDFYDKNDAVISGGSWFITGGTDGGVGSDAWATVTSFGAVVPANAAYGLVALMGGWSSDSGWIWVDWDQFYICTSPMTLNWAPHAGEVLPAMTFADQLAANAVYTKNIAAGQVNSDHVVTVGLDAAVIKFGSMDGDRITANTAVFNILEANTSLTAKDLFLGSGGQLVANSTTTGVVLNSNGIRLLSGGVAKVTLDAATGTASFEGNIKATSGELGTLTVTGTLTGGTIQGTLYRSAAVGTTRVEILNIGEAATVYFYSSTESPAWQAANIAVIGSGDLQIVSRYKPARGIITLNSVGGLDGYGYTAVGSESKISMVFSAGHASTTGNITFGTSYVGHVSANSGSFETGDWNWGLRINSTPGTFWHTAIVYYGTSSGQDRRGGIFNHATGWVAYGDDYGAHIVPSGREIKDNIRPVAAGDSSLAKIKNLRPQWYERRFDHSNPDRTGFVPTAPPPPRSQIGLIAEEVKEIFPEVISEQGEGAEYSIGINHMALLTRLIHAVQELQAEVDVLKARP